MIEADFTGLSRRLTPFAHVRIPAILSQEAGQAVLEWFETDAPWQLKITDFYEQLEFSLLQANLPENLRQLVSKEFVGSLASMLRKQFETAMLELTDIVAHRMISGQTIRIHNDFLGAGEETHRCIVQINRGWKATQGGLLMLFEFDDPESVRDILIPDHRSAFAFEISRHSHHAVSTVHKGQRDTIVYTFRSFEP